MPTPNHAALVDHAAQCADIANFWFLGVAGSVTATGFFVDAQGRRTGGSFSTTIPVANGSNDPVRIASVPADAVGAIVRLSGATHFDLSQDAFGTDFKTNYARYPQYASGVNVALGRVQVA